MNLAAAIKFNTHLGPVEFWLTRYDVVGCQTPMNSGFLTIQGFLEEAKCVLCEPGF